MTASSAGALPRGRQQVNDIRRTKEAAEFDPLYSLMLMCKEAEGKNPQEAFVRLVNGGSCTAVQSIAFGETSNVQAIAISNVGGQSVQLLPQLVSTSRICPTRPPPLVPQSFQLLPQVVSSSVFPVSPPPLIPAMQLQASSPQQQRPLVGSPVFVCFVRGNISRCNGCKGRIARAANKKPLPPPGDIVLRHKERVVYLNSRTGVYEQSRDDRNVYYHAYRTCVASHFLDFDATYHIKVDAAVELSALHLHHLREEFDVRFL